MSRELTEGDRRGSQVCCCREIGIREDDQRGLATQFQIDGLLLALNDLVSLWFCRTKARSYHVRSRSSLHDRAAGANRAGERDFAVLIQVSYWDRTKSSAETTIIFHQVPSAPHEVANRALAWLISTSSFSTFLLLARRFQ